MLICRDMYVKSYMLTGYMYIYVDISKNKDMFITYMNIYDHMYENTLLC